MSKKAENLIPLIIEANDRDKAIEVLSEVLNALYLSTSYTKMVKLQDRLKHYQKEFKTITEGLNEEGVVIEYEQLNHIRISLSFLYRDIQDELSAPINSNKIYYEEVKTARRADALSELKGSDEALELGAKSTSALKDILGASKSYREYASEYAIAYGNYRTLINLLDAVKNVLDAVASRERNELHIKQKDAK